MVLTRLCFNQLTLVYGAFVAIEKVLGNVTRLG